ncbi:hypothetical protein T4E_10629 [Trichinella pseudospiralis]|uniref:Uncharacterized protein n=1 Tax=Trichinella pseudospiralis TaxID=6337 RepID=A0A0V0Y2Z4_TRIPS|nr:hypothetical protein T4E_10629 [Trichinella pseudospiralis]
MKDYSQAKLCRHCRPDFDIRSFQVGREFLVDQLVLQVQDNLVHQLLLVLLASLVTRLDQQDRLALASQCRHLHTDFQCRLSVRKHLHLASAFEFDLLKSF